MSLNNHHNFKSSLPYGSGSGEVGSGEINDFIVEAHDGFRMCEETIVMKIEQALTERENYAAPPEDDKIFAAFTEYVEVARQFGFLQQPIRLWLHCIAPKIKDFEDEHSVHVHKGSPIYNVGLCYLESGDMDNGFRFITEANCENCRAGLPGLLEQIEKGELPEQVFIGSIEGWVTQELGASYKSLTNRALTKQELKSIIFWLTSTKEADAIQALISLHRLNHLSKNEPNNSASIHLRVQSLADLVLILESNLKKSQSDPSAKRTKMTLCPLLEFMLKNYNDSALKQFKSNLTEFKEKDISEIILDLFEKLDAESDLRSKVGTACYLVYRLRNSLMHVIGEPLCIDSDIDKLYRVAGIVLAVMYICQQSNAN
jgi:hypothetical protein